MNYKLLSMALILATCLVACGGGETRTGSSSQTGVVTAASVDPSATTQRIVVKYKNVYSVTAQSNSLVHISSLEKRARHKMHVHKTTTQNAVVYEIDEKLNKKEAKVVAMSLASDPSVEYAELDHYVKPASVSYNDTYFGYQWNLQPSSSSNKGGSNLLNAAVLASNGRTQIAVLDTGYISHPDLSSIDPIVGYDMISDATIAGDGGARDLDPTDVGDSCANPASNSSWHGIKVAGIIAANVNNGYGVVGGFPNATIVPVRVLGKCGGWLSDVADAIIWASGGTVTGVPTNNNPSKVLNLSLTAQVACPSYIQSAIASAKSRNVVVVAAAGNSVSSTSEAPANCTDVIAVAAHNRSGDLASYSNYNSSVTLSAPGGGSCKTLSSGCLSDAIPILSNNGATTSTTSVETTFGLGTSFATPHVSATIGILKSINPEFTVDEIRSILISTVQPHPTGTFCALNSGMCGAGMLDSFAAVNSVLAPTVSFTVSSSPVAGNTSVQLVAVPSKSGSYTYSWTQTGGANVVMAGANTNSMSFTTSATKDTLKFKVTLTTSLGQVVSDERVVTVNNHPVLSAGGTDSYQIVSGGTNTYSKTFTLTDADGEAVTLGILSGPSGAAINGQILTWNNPTVGTYTFVLQGFDASGLVSNTSNLVVTVLADPNAPSSTPTPSPTPNNGSGGSANNSNGSSSGGGGGAMDMTDLLFLLLFAGGAFIGQKKKNLSLNSR
jgi:serine protease